jgi:hypothetical protein
MDSTKGSVDLIQTAEIVQNYLEMNGSLSLTQHRIFWTNLGNSDIASSYVSILLAKLVQIDLGLEKAVTLIDLVKKLSSGDPPATETPKPNSNTEEPQVCIL